MVAEIVSLAMEYYRNPLGYRQLTDPSRPIYKPCEGLVDAFGTALGPNRIQATAAGLGTTPKHLEEAARFFVRQVLLAPGSDHYRVLGLAPGATEEKIRRHYHFLAGMFHPDRSPSDLERSTSVMARINEAYNVLRSPQGRQTYARKLAAVAGTNSIAAAAPTASSPAYSPPPPGFTSPPESHLVRRRSTFAVVAWMTLALLAMFIAAAILDSINPPHLRVRRESNQASISKPSYFQGDQPATFITPSAEVAEDTLAFSSPNSPNTHDDSQAKAPHTEQAQTNTGEHPTNLATGDTNSPPPVGETTVGTHIPVPAPRDAAAPARTISPVPTRSALDAARDFIRKETKSANRTSRGRSSTSPSVAHRVSPRTERHRTTAPKSPPTAQATAPRPSPKKAPPSVNPGQANGVISRLASCYKKGNLGCLVGLFTKDARVNDGSGTAFIRTDYDTFFKRTSQRRLSVRKLRWRATDKGKMTATGAFTASTKDTGSSDWQRQSGTIRFELLKSGNSYKISEMIYSYGP